ncbi:MAG: hypothetical protein ACK4NF_00300 [Planctomycetota bacterium]
MQFKVVLILHALAGVSITALSFHIFFWTLKAYKEKIIFPLKYTYSILRIFFLLYILQIVTAFIIYPVYRVYVRGSKNDKVQSVIKSKDYTMNLIYFDRNFVTGTFLFEIKEHLGALVLPLVISVMASFQYFIKNNIPVTFLTLCKIFLLLLFLTYNTISGFFLTSIKSL